MTRSNKTNKIIITQKKRKQPKQQKTLKRVSNFATTAAKVAGPALRALAGLPFEVSGTNAVATPSRVIGPVQVSAPAASGLVTRTTGPRMKTSSQGNMRVAHREYICDVDPSAQTNANTFQLLYNHAINPGNGLMFPWLSQIAPRFESYLFSSLRFIYEPQTSTTTSGTVSMVVDYDALDAAPLDKSNMMGYKGAVRSPPWFTCAYNCAISDLRKEKTYYVRGAADANSDSRLSDVGRFYLAYEGPSGAQFAAGELYVEYDVELMTPQLQPYAVAGRAYLPIGTYTFGSSMDGTFATHSTGSSPPTVLTTVASYTNAFVVYAPKPGIYQLIFRIGVSYTTTAGPSVVGVQPITGSNATVYPYTQSVNYPTGTVNPVFFAETTVNFPTIYDGVEVYLTGSGAGFGSLTFTGGSIDLYATQASVYGFPATSSSNALAILNTRSQRLAAALAKLSLNGPSIAAMDSFRKDRPYAGAGNATSYSTNTCGTAHESADANGTILSRHEVVFQRDPASPWQGKLKEAGAHRL